MALRRCAAPFMPLQLVANVDREVVFVLHLQLRVLRLPVHYIRSCQLPKIEMHLVGRDILAVKRQCRREQ
jgi:hypothetical protein